MDPWNYWNETIKAPKFILAPMVDHSELPWRMLSREYGCQAAYTPMFHATHFATSKKYRQKSFSTCLEDNPLFVQFCSNSADTLVAASKFVEDCCNGIDINLGCPQDIARRGHYGAFLQEEWQLIDEMVTRLRSNLDQSSLAVSCKIRRFEELDKTLDYARMLEKAGCTFIGFHARTRDQRGCKTGLADWNYIKAVKESVNIPIVANGNIQSLRDANDCLEFTRADAIMTAEGNLYNPALFYDVHPPAWTVANKYLDYVKQYPIPAGMAKSHIFKLFHKCVSMEENADLREKLGRSTTLDELYDVVNCFRKKYENVEEDQSMTINTHPVPPYLCQARFRYDAPKMTTITNNENKCDDDARLDRKSEDIKRIKTENLAVC